MVDMQKLLSLIEALVDKVGPRVVSLESDVKTNKAKAESDVADVRTFAEGLLKTAAPAPAAVDPAKLDEMVKDALAKVMPDVDLSSLEAKVDALGSAPAAKTDPAPAPAPAPAPPSMPTFSPLVGPIALPPVPPATMPAPASKKVDLSTLFSGPIAPVTSSASPAAVGSADTSTTTLGSQGSQDPTKTPEAKPASVPQKIDPAAAGKLAADAASDAGDDPVSAAAKAAHAAAVELGVDPVKSATDAAQAAGAGPIEALRAAQNADLAANEGQAPATA